jgi:hypothetical protein
VYILNRTPTKGVEGATPFELWYGKKPTVQHLRTFGCIAYVRNTRPHLSKLEDRDRKMIFIGYEQGTKGYTVYDPVEKVHITRDVVFDESAQWDWSNDSSVENAGGEDFGVEYMVWSTRTTGFQRQGLDYEEVFALVTRLEAIRLLLALAANQNWEVHHMDVKSAFLNGDLTEEVYVTQPPGFVAAGSENKVLRLKKALYGLHQAPRAWYQKLDESLTSVGFLSYPSDPAIYCRGNKKGDRLVVGVYVDDLVITGSSQQEILKFKSEMARMFRMSDLGLLHYYFGIEVRQDQNGFVLSQSSYVKMILEKGGMSDCNPVKCPWSPS